MSWKKYFWIGASLLLVLLATGIGFYCWIKSFTKQLESADLSDSVWITQVIVGDIFWISTLFLIGWIGYLLHQQWLKEREYNHIIQQEQEAREERASLTPQTTPTLKNTVDSFGALLGQIKKLTSDDFIEKNTAKELTQLLTEKLKNLLDAQFPNLEIKQDKSQDKL